MNLIVKSERFSFLNGLEQYDNWKRQKRRPKFLTYISTRPFRELRIQVIHIWVDAFGEIHASGAV